MRRRLNTGTVGGQRSMTSARVIESRSSGFIVALAGEGSGHPHATARRAIQLALAQARRRWWIGRRSRLLGDLHQPMRLRDDEMRRPLARENAFLLPGGERAADGVQGDRKSTRLNSSH